ncbi:MAG: hypothetical protein IH823_07290 [Candidatus Dadabacteria bacterium]|nr:hypothetical protein [Candidatus Dadabacteria bacterium]
MEADSVRFHMISKMLQGIGLICTAIEVRRNRLPAGATRRQTLPAKKVFIHS